ncbi:MAG: hypothetical protein WD358_02065 [Nitriliruptoraceae bacterium]
MRRVLGVALATVLLATIIAMPAAADDADVAGESIVLAVDGEGLGPEPQPRLAEENKARELAGYENPDVPFTWGAAWILTFTGMVGLALLIALYWLLVHRPSRRATEGA